MEPLVGIIIGSDSDLGVMSKTAEILERSIWNSLQISPTIKDAKCL